jgi:hypothetical protein
MSLSLYAATVPAYIQILGSVAGLLTKAEQYCVAKSVAPEEIIQARFTEDMLPFAFQVQQCGVHSLGAIEGVRRGVFSPHVSPPPDNFAALKGTIADALAGVEALKPEEIEGMIGRDMRFSFRDRHIDFTAEDFLLTFSQPNFYFHATTAYDLLRWKGVPLGKRDYIGRMRVKA